MTDARDFYEKNRAIYHVPAHLTGAEIVFAIPPNATPDQIAAIRAKAQDAATTARNPKLSFAVLATHVSDGPTAAVGGDLGRVTRETADPAVWTALSALRPGDVSPVVTTPSALRVVKLTGRVAAVETPFAGARAASRRRCACSAARRDWRTSCRRCESRRGSRTVSRAAIAASRSRSR